MSIDIDKVLAAVRAMPSWSEVPNELAGHVLIDFVRGLPELLGERLEERVTLGGFLTVKALIAQNMLDSGFVKKMIAAANSDAVDVPLEGLAGALAGLASAFFDDETMLSMGHTALEQVVETHNEIAENPEDFLAQQGVDEETFFAHPRAVGLSGEVMDLYRAGELTFARLLELQPEPLIKMS